jgi:cell wall-associated NlpC family hydrolase
MAASTSLEYCCHASLNLYDAPNSQRLATQAASGRHLTITGEPDPQTHAVPVRLCEDDYSGWLMNQDLSYLKPAVMPYRPQVLPPEEIRSRVEGAIAFAYAAMQQPNHYLWGGTIGPNYDCSGLVQTAFASVGIWLPRDAYQQEAFVMAIPLADLLPGDLVFFGSPEKATHVGIYLGGDRYLHSSGKEQGRNGIGIDRLLQEGDAVSLTYRAQIRGAGRVIACYAPQCLVN